MDQNKQKKKPTIKDNKIDPNTIEKDNSLENLQEEDAFIEDFKKGRVIHILFFMALLIIIIVAVVEFSKWNHGTRELIDPNEDTSQFDSESNDFIVTLGSTLLDGHEDDGITTILCLGDESLSVGQGTDSICDLLESYIPNSNVYNISFPGSTMSTLDSVWDYDTCNDAFTPYWIINAMILKDYTIMDLSLNSEALTIQDETYEDTFNRIKSIDLNNVDVIVLTYGMNDYLQNRMVTNVADLNDIRSFSGAFQATINKIQENYPHIRILFSSPTFAMVEDENGILTNSSLISNDYGTFPGYLDSITATAVANSYISYVDNYLGSAINETTYKEFLTNNWLSNINGRTLVAKKLAAILDGTYVKN